MTTRLIRECKSAIARNNPALTQREIGIALIELNYGKELATAVDHYQLDRANGLQGRPNQRTSNRQNDD